jgi:HEPN domain-containing protein
MTPALEEARRYLRLADADIAAFRVLAANPDIRLAIVCFHAQQAAEKCLKAMLFTHSVEFRRTHDLHELASLVTETGAALPCTMDALDRLNPYAVIFRYDDTEIETLTRDQAASLIETIRTWAGNILARIG